MILAVRHCFKCNGEFEPTYPKDKSCQPCKRLPMTIGPRSPSAGTDSARGWTSLGLGSGGFGHLGWKRGQHGA